MNLGLDFGLFFVVALHGIGIAAAKTCPDPIAIFPCTCKAEEEALLLDCSLVDSDDQLYDLLSQPVPSEDFKTFSIHNNWNLTTIRKGTFGDMTFEEVDLKVGNIEVIEAGALLGSSETLRKLTIFNHELKSFPFEEVEKYTQLGSLKFDFNRLEELPDNIKSETLYHLDMSRNPLKSIGADVLQGFPNLQDVSFEACELTEVLSGTFTRLPKLNTVSVYSNNLSSIPSGLIELHGPSSYVYMGINSVSEIEAAAFEGVSHFFDLDFNSLTQVEEDVWRPMLERGTGIYLVGNPLECGCDIKWLIENPRFVNQLDPYAACANGTLIKDLSLESFIGC